jgi:uncharacterized membrane protein
MTYVASYIAAFVFFLSVDVVWIKSVARPLFERYVGDMLLETPRLGTAATFYALYVAGIIYFSVIPAVSGETWRIAALNGAIIGFLAYGTYEATNLATLKGWTYEMAVIDLVWGLVLTSMTAVVGYAAFRWMAG